MAAGVAVSQQAAHPAESRPLSVAEAVAGIVDYTRWPEPQVPLHLCFVGASEHRVAIAARLGAVAVASDLDESDPRLTDCGALYVGAYGAAAWRTLAPRLADIALLTLCERSEPCANAGMFALDIGVDGAVRFEVNLDAVGRSRVRIHPQVLMLGRRAR